ncbi:pyrroline-5-carboxylate reductase [Beijerinckia indica]|uniref:Pyrroline-5-carboxylate reductase n=1 Tax=Beijerinckia indica subsp. indica (strain ATCC 9039 / DSM 1715 / NCIMB 8712) TaxID=395963 RepID=B2IJM7_BEII9|nr:pyrroline-5-carboxylate reductase [Beijerinckia indica]ACB94899.1 pyrroline-5-carboxylate reductase [Beijerinckia indica subsp. indica ATCC 9039]
MDANDAKSAFPQSLILAGAGKMGSALLHGWLSLGLPAARVGVIEPHPSEPLRERAKTEGFTLTPPAKAPDVLVLAIKPQMLEEAAPALQAYVDENTLIISILAGKTIRNIAERFPRAGAIIRAMPNLPAAIGHGMTGLAASAGLTPHQHALATTLLGAVGAVEWLDDESLIDAVTAISGSGPAYVFYLAECLSRAGAALGLPPAVAERLARATVEGGGALLAHEADTSPAQLRENVTSRGGTTAAALEILMAENGLAPLIERTAAAAQKRAAELSG